MIGKAEWFQRRKYGGWGLQPKTWQGWVYIACFILPLLIFHILPFWSTQLRLIVTGFWALLLIIDTLDIMRKLNLDERERFHEAIAERNALWGVLVVLVIGMGYDLITNGLNERIYVNPFIAAALIVAVIIKAVSNIYLDRKD